SPCGSSMPWPSSTELLSQVKERVDHEVVRWIRHRIGWTTGTPLSGTPHEGTAIAHGACGHEVEVVAGDHQNFTGLKGEPCGSDLVRCRKGLIDADHLTRDDAVPGDVILARHIHDQRGA